MDLAPIYLKYEDDFEYKDSGEILFKPTASNYAIKAYFLQESIYKQIKGDNAIINFMIDEFKKSNIYVLKSEAERKAIIKFLKDNSNIEEILREEDDEEDDEDSDYDDVIVIS